MQNPNCMNVCLANELLTEIDKYANVLGMNRDFAIRRLKSMMAADTMKHRAAYNAFYPAPWTTT